MALPRRWRILTNWQFLIPRVTLLQALSLKQYPKNIMENNFLANLYAREMQAEYTSTKKCLEKIPADIYSFKPHPKSMELGYLALLVAEIPLWITHIVKEGVIDFATYKRYQLSTAEALLQHLRRVLKVLWKPCNKQQMIGWKKPLRCKRAARSCRHLPKRSPSDLRSIIGCNTAGN